MPVVSVISMCLCAGMSFTRVHQCMQNMVSNEALFYGRGLPGLLIIGSNDSFKIYLLYFLFFLRCPVSGFTNMR